ncbi:MAG TPA: hypothetical protein VFA07_01505 [Chthonomonadaceae bacterium]|nr:hypothetical protein [Chthonomonadaceae bacterium]
MATAAKTKKTETPQNGNQLAARFAGDLVYKALLDVGEPVKASEVAKAVGRSDVDLKLVRVVLSTNPNMTAVDRKWTIWTRFLDTRRTLDYNLKRILDTFGQPIHLPQLARELSAVYGRPAEIYEEMLERLATGKTRYFLIDPDYIASRDWLLDVEAEDPNEVLYANFLEDEQVLPLQATAKKGKLDPRKPETFAALLDAANKPVLGKAIQFLAWQADKEHFHAEEVYAHLFLDSGALPLSDGTWIGPKLAGELAGHFAELAKQEVSENIEAEAQEAAQPLVIGPEERKQLEDEIHHSEGTVHATRLLEDVFEITPDYRTYNEDLQTVIRTLQEDERVVWVGADRFRPQGSIPSYVYSVPALLDIPTRQYYDADGNPIDQFIEDDGFDGGLQREILNPLVQDVLDEEPVPPADPNPPSNVRAVIKYHHKQIGTMPLCQFPSGFFPPEPVILETEFTMPGGQKAQVWVNNETRLLYGLLDWFQSIPIDSGATFTLERQAPDRYVINYNDESEPAMFISRNRVNELLALQERADAEDLPTFDIVREIMEHYRKGIEFLTLHTEVNLVRRVHRRLVASLLSEYHCFFQRGGAWVFDAKKLSQGFDKSKRKYLVKS